ncbi:MAG: tetratricopeptide repeat protein [Verrucomicrobia bacterium]|nr:tetratricopeptide repeat protein [Verrucomicrobiota bacterium]
MRRFFTPLCVRLYAFLALSLALFHAWPHAMRSEWNRERLYRRLLSGNDKERIAAGEQLVAHGGRDQLQRALQSDSASIRTVAISALFDIWVAQEGEEAALLLQVADNSIEQKNLRGALSHLTRLTRTHPFFAEGWNRRATLLWRLGQVEQSLADCRKAVLIDPDHFAAWQGMGLCQVRLGDLSAAQKSFQQALKLIPHDRQTQRYLRWAEDTLKREKQRQPRQPEPVGELV